MKTTSKAGKGYALPDLALIYITKLGPAEAVWLGEHLGRNPSAIYRIWSKIRYGTEPDGSRMRGRIDRQVENLHQLLGKCRMKLTVDDLIHGRLPKEYKDLAGV